MSGTDSTWWSRAAPVVGAGVLLVGTAIGIASCGGHGSSRAAPVNHGSRSFDLPTARGVGENAVATGTLRFTERDCPYLEDPDGGRVGLGFLSGAVRGETRGSERMIVDTADGHVWAVEGEKARLGGGPPVPDQPFQQCLPGAGSRFVAERDASPARPD